MIFKMDVCGAGSSSKWRSI